MRYFSATELQQRLDFPTLIIALEQAFRADYQVPLRHHHNYQNASTGEKDTLLLMPAWEVGGYLGVKMVTVAPQNAHLYLPSIQGIYTLFDTKNGTPLVQMDARMLTNLRTAAASALAAKYLARTDSHTLLMIGTGALAPFLIRAHCSIRPIEKVYIWGRNLAKAEQTKLAVNDLALQVEVVTDIEKTISKVDIISCATLSQQPLVYGHWLHSGQHIDLVGSYQPHTREADDEVMRRAKIYVDTHEGATKESGDIVLPLQDKVIQITDIIADLFELCQQEKTGRQKQEAITVFKSVGHALEDLAVAKLMLL